ncbi:outer membrane protein assembly factor BamC [Ideonella sp. BN130291]|uniref:outer membrane protein assembly factor BamC n=1 Tax=Ideonella sp. BN130291 TaxID=3112940 RepID=UPI002EAB0CC8|nr:outer membrane protein assembly factor BamC [Ideonella sp. BN130291]
MRNVNRFPSISPVRAATLALVMGLAGCSSMENMLSGDKIDYKSAAAKTTPLEVPPDLTQLQREGRFQPQAGVVSANNYQNPAAAGAAPVAATGPAVAPQQVGEVRVERNGNTRWLVTTQSPEQVWPQLRSFWQDRGFNIAIDSPEAGVMETDWAENRAKLANDWVRNTIGKFFDSLYSTGERDKFRTRIERTPQGTEIFISHRGMEEVLTGQAKDSTLWRQRPTDPGLEAEMLARLMVKLGSKEQDARSAVLATAPAAAASGAAPATPTAAATPAAPARARLLTDLPAAALQVDEPFDRAWRRVGLALDRTGFTVEDRDRANGVYYVRYADPKQAGKEDPGFFSKLFGGDKSGSNAPARYRIEVKRGGTENTTVSVLNAQGAPEKGDIGQRIVNLLVDDLK